MTSFASIVVALLAKEYGIGDIGEACLKSQQLALTLMDLIHDAEKGRLEVTMVTTTHSSTVLPQISAGGSLRPKLFVVLQEPGGKLPNKGHFQANNLVVKAHSSYIMTKGLMIEWLKEAVFIDDLPARSLLILDSWNPFRDHDEIQKHVPKGKKGVHHEHSTRLYWKVPTA